MVELDLTYKINIPFAQNGDKDEIPDTSAEGLVNNTDGLGVKYETPIGQGGEYYTREIINGALYKVYAAVKEIQEIAETAGFPVDMTKELNVLPIANGGTGANNATNARANLGLGTIATLNIINAANIADNAVTNTKINDGAVTQDKLASSVVGNLPIGFIYFQLRGQATPDVLFKTSGKWQDISSTYAGEFFRAVGGNSGGFGSTQAEGLPNITGTLTNTVLFKNDVSYSSSGAFTHTVNQYGQYSSGSNMNLGNLIFQASRVSSIYGASTHVTPYNSAIRIWKKIA